MKKLMMMSVCVLAMAAAAEFRLASYNIRFENAGDKDAHAWSARKGRVAKMIKDKKFDVAGLQEVTGNQRKDLEAALPEFTFVGKHREDGKLGGEGSLVIFRKDRFEMLKEDTFWLSETPTVPGSKSWETACPRVCTYVQLKDKRDDHKFFLFNTHLDHVSQAARENGIKLIIKKMEEVAGEEDIIFFTGDLNSKPDSKVVSLLEEKLGNSFDKPQEPAIGPWRTFNDWKYFSNDEDTSEEPGKGDRIDYIFSPQSNERLHVKTYNTYNDSENNEYPSDHFPICVLLEWAE